MWHTPFIGMNWFQLQDKINEIAAKHGVSTNLKVEGDAIEGTKIPLKDFDIMADDTRLTIKIDAKGAILSIKLG